MLSSSHIKRKWGRLDTLLGPSETRPARTFGGSVLTSKGGALLCAAEPLAGPHVHSEAGLAY